MKFYIIIYEFRVINYIKVLLWTYEIFVNNTFWTKQWFVEVAAVTTAGVQAARWMLNVPFLLPILQISWLTRGKKIIESPF